MRGDYFSPVRPPSAKHFPTHHPSPQTSQASVMREGAELQKRWQHDMGSSSRLLMATSRNFSISPSGNVTSPSPARAAGTLESNQLVESLDRLRCLGLGLV